MDIHLRDFNLRKIGEKSSGLREGKREMYKGRLRVERGGSLQKKVNKKTTAMTRKGGTGVSSKTDITDGVTFLKEIEHRLVFPCNPSS